jgi:hypothetical protein
MRNGKLPPADWSETKDSGLRHHLEPPWGVHTPPSIDRDSKRSKWGASVAPLGHPNKARPRDAANTNLHLLTYNVTRAKILALKILKIADGYYALSLFLSSLRALKVGLSSV